MLRLRKAKDIVVVKAKRQCSLGVEASTPSSDELWNEKTAWMMAAHEICQALSLMKYTSHGVTMTAQLLSSRKRPVTLRVSLDTRFSETTMRNFSYHAIVRQDLGSV